MSSSVRARLSVVNTNGDDRERADAVGEAGDFDPVAADLGGIADAVQAELVEIGAVDEHGVARADAGERAFDDIPGREAAILDVGADHDSEGGAARPASSIR